MANTYRAKSREHRSLVAVRMASERRTPAVLVGNQCSATASCSNAGIVVALKGIDPVMWPVICEGHLAAMGFGSSERKAS